MAFVMIFIKCNRKMNKYLKNECYWVLKEFVGSQYYNNIIVKLYYLFKKLLIHSPSAERMKHIQRCVIAEKVFQHNW